MQKDEKYQVVTTKVSPEARTRLELLCKRKGLTPYELLQMVIDHGIAAVFDDDTLAGELLQPWQRFNKHFCLLIGAQIGVHVEMEPRSLQFCRQFFSFLRRRRRYRCRLLQTAHWAVCQLS